MTADDGIDETGRATIAREKAAIEKAAAEEQRLHGDEAAVPPSELQTLRAERAAAVAAQAVPVVGAHDVAVEGVEPALPENHDSLGTVADTQHASAARRQPRDRTTTTLGDK